MRRKIPVLLFLLFLLFSFPAAAADDEGRTLEDARTLIGAKAFSRKGLITQLEEMGHPRSAAEQAADGASATESTTGRKQDGTGDPSAGQKNHQFCGPSHGRFCRDP